MADIYSIGFDKLLNRGEGPLLNSSPLLYDSSTILNPISESIPPEILQSGEMSGIYFSGKTSFSDTTNGFRQGIDTDGTYKWIMGTTGNSIDWNVTTANTLTISGAISASTIDIGGADATSFHVDVDGNMWLGAATFAAATAFKVSNAGVLTSISGTIAAFTLAATTISATNLTITSGAANTANISVGTGSNLAGMNSGNAGTDIAFWSGNTFTNRATAPFRVNLQGDVTMTSATITGSTLGDYQTFTADGTWTKPAGAQLVIVACIGAGGGGGGGTSSSLYGTGGGGGAYIQKVFKASDLGSTVAVTVGAAGTAGSPNTNGGTGGVSSFGALLSAYGGGGGLRGTGTGGSGGGGGGTAGAGSTGVDNGHSIGGSPATTSKTVGLSGQGAGCENAQAGLAAEYGGGAGGAGLANGGGSLNGGAGGGGGGYSSGGVGTAGGAGGNIQSYSNGGGGAGGAAGVNGTAGSSGDIGAGGGGGGGEVGAAQAGNGGAGGTPGGGGGGGGGGGTTSPGNGGAGGRGEVRVYTI